jgi:hypothetical protein
MPRKTVISVVLEPIGDVERIDPARFWEVEIWIVISECFCRRDSNADVTAKASDCSLSNWQVLTRHLDDGNVPIDDRAAENAVRTVLPAGHKPAGISLSGAALGLRKPRLWQHRALAK